MLVEHGELDMRNCTVRDVRGTRALHVSGGNSAVQSSRFEANLGGAVAASSGSRLLISSSFLVGNMVANGGALAVTGNLTEVTVAATRIERNSATLRGGGLHVAAGSVILANHTALEENAAPEGATMHLSGGTTVFALPAPSGRWVNTAVPMEVPSVQPGVATLVSTLVLGSQDEDYPFACPPGTWGTDSDIKTQLSPVCVGACPAGSLCPSATSRPSPCTVGTYCPRGSAAGTFCPLGTVGYLTNLTSPDECVVCPAGYVCVGGLASSCPRSTYNPLVGQSLQATACKQCPTNSRTVGAAATSGTDCVCLAGHYNFPV